MKKLILIIMTIFLLAGCGKAAKQPDPIDDNYRVFYEIFTGSFSDSNGDGTGDLQGIINRLDYLNDGNINSGKSLGIQGIWLTPVFASPSYHKYDVKDYYTIDPQFGTMDDLKKLVEECHKRNVSVILDMVINHTSREHEWFKAFTKAHQNDDPSDPYYDWYTWTTKDQMPSGHTWKAVGRNGHYYECNFSDDMPELNYDNEEVRKAVLEIAKYYLDLGIDGFRFDAAKYIYYGDNQSSIEFWKWYVAELKKIKADVYTVGEVWSGDPEVIPYNAALNCFNFSTGQAEGQIANAARGGNVNTFVNYIVSYNNRIKAQNEEAMLIPFIANHDMDRAAGYLTVSSGQAYAAANLYLLSPGSPFIYYGEEIGMKGSRGAANTDANRRLAMLWGDEDTVKDPVGSTFQASKQVNGTVAEQLKDPESLLNYYGKVIAFRNRYPQIARGEYSAFTLKDSYMGAFRISYNDEVTYLIHNTGSAEATIDLSDYPVRPETIIEAIGKGTAEYKDGWLTVGPQTSVLMK